VVAVLRDASRAFLVGCLALGIAGCGAAQRPEQRAAVRFVIEPESARVYSDERFIGSARVLAVRPAEFRTGRRRFTITADGFFPHDFEVDLPPGMTTIEVRLRPVPP
jgi:hypothetical protein